MHYKTNVNIGDLVWMGAWEHTAPQPYCIVLDHKDPGYSGECFLLFLVEQQTSYWIHASSINHWGFDGIFQILVKLNDQE